MARSGQESGVREIRLRRSMRRGLETGSSGHRASPRPYGVPKVVINDRVQFEGAVPEQDFLGAVLQAVETS